jgi:hypothetical protein
MRGGPRLRPGMAACGHPRPARPPSLSRLAHVRAVLAARLWLASSPAYADAGAWWHSERRIRAGLPPPRVGTSHVADGEVHWPSTEAAGQYAGQVGAVEVELTPKPAARTVGYWRVPLWPARCHNHPGLWAASAT